MPRRQQESSLDLSREFERQAELIGLADELAAMIPPVCEACGQTIERKKA